MSVLLQTGAKNLNYSCNGNLFVNCLMYTFTSFNNTTVVEYLYVYMQTSYRDDRALLIFLQHNKLYFKNMFVTT